MYIVDFMYFAEFSDVLFPLNLGLAHLGVLRALQSYPMKESIKYLQHHDSESADRMKNFYTFDFIKDKDKRDQRDVEEQIKVHFYRFFGQVERECSIFIYRVFIHHVNGARKR